MAVWTPPGKRNKIVVIQQITGTTTDSYGGTIPVWGAFTTVWAFIRPLRGRDLVAAQAAQNLTELVFNIRYVAGVLPTMRLVYDSKNYDITALINIEEANREIDIMAKTGLSEG